MASIPPNIVAQAASIYNIPTYPLSIGGTSFTNDEAPSSLEFGFSQQMAEHELIGGGVQTQLLGTRFKDVTWEGTLLDAGAFDRYRSLKLMYLTGQVQTLSYKTEIYDCNIKDFTYTIYHDFKVGYRITVRILRDRSGSTAQPAGPSIDDQVQALYAQAANDYAAVSGVDAATDADVDAALNDMANSLDEGSPLASAGSQQQCILASVQSAIVAAQGYQGVTTAALLTVGQTAAVNSLLNGLTCISKAVASGQPPQTISVLGGSLYKIAVQYGGTPSYARQIRSLNNLSSMQLEEGVLQTLLLPPVPPS